MKYYYSIGDKPTGPVTLEELKNLRAQGLINDMTKVIREGEASWSEYYKIAGGSLPISYGSSFDVGKLSLGIWLFIKKIFTLSWEIVRRSAIEVAEWGNKRALPTDESELPVITFIAIVSKPIAIFLYCIGVVLAALVWPIIFLVSGEVLYAPFAFIGLLVGGYLALPIIALYFDLIALGVLTVNKISNIERKLKNNE